MDQMIFFTFENVRVNDFKKDLVKERYVNLNGLAEFLPVSINDGYGLRLDYFHRKNENKLLSITIEFNYSGQRDSEIKRLLEFLGAKEKKTF